MSKQAGMNRTRIHATLAGFLTLGVAILGSTKFPCDAKANRIEGRKDLACCDLAELFTITSSHKDTQTAERPTTQVPLEEEEEDKSPR